jgi:hypothetical protein
MPPWAIARRPAPRHRPHSPDRRCPNRLSAAPTPTLN